MKFHFFQFGVKGLLSVFAMCLAAEIAVAVDFETDVRPFLEKKCLGCHNPNIAKGGLALAEASVVLDPDTDLVVPGHALKSDLYLAATPESPGEKPYMPEEGEPLTEAEAEILRQWIDAGAMWPKGLVLKEASKADRSWWSYLPLSEPAQDSIDAYLGEKLAANGLEMNPPAKRRDLIRRATYDLIGLPPTPEEVEAFVADEDPKAYENLAERLLASPRYGERWGRHCLDVVRFGESKGYERNVVIDNAWPFRDYVILSVNDDKPFDQLMREHLAGDVFGKDQPDIEIGSAFLVAGPYDDVNNQDKAATAQIRANTLDEIINATGEAFLGMTLGCARCHDHKFDPISHRDYYGLYATFAGVRHEARVLATTEERRAISKALRPLTTQREELEAGIKGIVDAIHGRAQKKLEEYESQWTRKPVDRTGTEERFPAVEARYVRLFSEAIDTNPNVSSGFRIDEFEIWSAEPKPRNVALASAGSKAHGDSRSIEDFPGAYGPHLAIDGKTGERYFASGNSLVIELPGPVRFDRVVFSSAKGEQSPAQGKFVFVADYRIEVSDDGENWREVAHGRDRKPANRTHRDFRLRTGERTAEETERIAGMRRELVEVGRKIDALPELPEVWLGKANEQDAKGPFHVFVGGSPEKRGEEVVAASLSTLAEVVPAYELPGDAPEAERRLAFADWVVHPDNPLVPRVLANRLWQLHFGTGIVDTPNDFGYMGGRPTHPELLDFLAGKLREHGWRLKPMHRLIMLSDAYRQSSSWQAEGGRLDGESRLLWRFPPRRLSAEEIRDTILATSGKLDMSMGGPGFRLYRFIQDNVSTYIPLDVHGPETYRRAVYHQNARASVVDLMTDFDQPDCAFSTPVRSETTTPLQALTMLNHSFTLEMAASLAARVREAGGEMAETHAKRAFRLLYQRTPDSEEVAKTAEAIQELGLEAVCRALLNSNELIYLD